MSDIITKLASYLNPWVVLSSLFANVIQFIGVVHGYLRHKKEIGKLNKELEEARKKQDDLKEDLNYTEEKISEIEDAHAELEGILFHALCTIREKSPDIYPDFTQRLGEDVLNRFGLSKGREN